MLLNLAIADAYGAGFKSAKTSVIREFNTGNAFMDNPKSATVGGVYTGKTQTALAVTEALINRDEWTHENLAKRLLECFHRDRRQSYPRRSYNLYIKTDSAAALLKKITPNGDDNRAAVRALPIGVLADAKEVMEKASIQAMLTHYTGEGIRSSVAAALITHYFVHKLGEKSKLAAFLSDSLPGDWNRAWNGPVGLKGEMTVRAAITAIVRNDSMKKLLMDCVSFTGQIDAVSAIACAAATHCPEIRQDIPYSLTENLENGAYGREYIGGLDAGLIALGK